MLRVVFFGNSEGVFSNRHFAALREASCDVVAVVDVPASQRASTNATSTNGRNFVDYARGRGVPAFEPIRPNAPDFVATLRDLRPDLFVAVGYLNRLREELLGVPRLAAANFHASLLPKYRGLHPVFRTLRGGERWGGLTVHVIDSGLDTGDILYQVRVRTRWDDSVGSLYGRIMERSVGLVGRLVADAGAGRLQSRPQAGDEGSYFSSLRDEDFRLEWERPAPELRRWICATPGRCFFERSTGRVFVVNAKLGGDAVAAPGIVLRLGRARCAVATGRGALSLGRVRAGEGEVNAADWCRQFGLSAGNSIA
jgi:methionyl-tRNA formyltransferase